MSKNSNISHKVQERAIFTSSYKLMLLMIKENHFIKLQLSRNNPQIWKRIYIISIFRTIECMVNYLKKDVINERKYQDLGLSKNQIKKLNEYYISIENGRKIRKLKKIPFSDNVIFAFDMFNNANFVFESINKSTVDWENFKNAINIRNRIVHPKFIKNLYVKNSELQIVENAYDWFFDTFSEFHKKGYESLMSQVNALKNVTFDVGNSPS